MINTRTTFWQSLYEKIKPPLYAITIGYGWWDILILPLFLVARDMYIATNFETRAATPEWFLIVTGIIGILLVIRSAYSLYVYLPYRGKLHSLGYALFETMLFCSLNLFFSETLPQLLFDVPESELIIPLTFVFGVTTDEIVRTVLQCLVLPRSLCALLLLVGNIVVRIFSFLTRRPRRTTQISTNHNHLPEQIKR